MSDANARFDELIQSYYRAWFRYHPEAAVDAGVPGYAHLLTPGSHEAKGALSCLNDELRVSLEEIDAADLDADRRVDYALLAGAVSLENQYLFDLEPRRPEPRRWLPVNAIYQLTIRPVENVEEALHARLRAIPEHLRDAREAVSAVATAVPPLWARGTVLAARRGADFVRGIVRHPRLGTFASRSEVSSSVAAAAEALAKFGDFVEQEVLPKARGDYACGKDYFEHLLRDRHFLDVGADRLHAFGERLFEQTRSELEQACREVFGHRDFIRAVHEIQQKNSPPPDDALLDIYRERMRAARRFVNDRKLASLPAIERLDVVETPEFLRHEIPFAAYSDPAPNDPEQIGHYYVTPPVDAAQLQEHDTIGLAITCVHEAYPGHHLQFTTANRHPSARSLPRLLNTSATLYEGWALYCEQLMFEQGFLDRPESRILLLRDRLWRALRIMLDVELQTRGLTLNDAADRMVKALGFPHSQAQADLAWYTRSPTVPFGYATGWAMIVSLREHLRAHEPKVDLQSFHDRLLSAGSIATPLVIQRVFGEPVWRAVKANVFGDSNG